jgi:hypothetical protein
MAPGGRLSAVDDSTVVHCECWGGGSSYIVEARRG